MKTEVPTPQDDVLFFFLFLALATPHTVVCNLQCIAHAWRISGPVFSRVLYNMPVAELCRMFKTEWSPKGDYAAHQLLECVGSPAKIKMEVEEQEKCQKKLR